MNWIVGQNLVGCLPNEALEFDNWYDAFQCLVENIELFWDEAEENEHYSLVESVMDVHTDLHLRENWNDDLCYIIGDEAFWLVRGE